MLIRCPQSPTNPGRTQEGDRHGTSILPVGVTTFLVMMWLATFCQSASAQRPPERRYETIEQVSGPALQSRPAVQDSRQTEALHRSVEELRRQNELLRAQLEELRRHRSVQNDRVVQTPPQRSTVPMRQPVRRPITSDARHRAEAARIMTQRRDGMGALNNAVNGELFDLANAIRGLDQSYYFKGHSSCKAWTASSGYLDREPQRVTVPVRPQVRTHAVPVCKTGLCPPDHLFAPEAKVFSWCFDCDGVTRLVLKGKASYVDGHLHLTDGAAIPMQRDDVIQQKLQSTNEMTLDVVLTPADLDQSGPTRIVSFSSNSAERNFSLCQEKDRLVLRLRTTNTGVNGTSPEVSFGQLTAGRSTHVRVSYRNGELICTQDGKVVLSNDWIKGDFRTWTAQHFILGDEWDGQRDWRGKVSCVALYNRFVAAERN